MNIHVLSITFAERFLRIDNFFVVFGMTDRTFRRHDWILERSATFATLAASYYTTEVVRKTLSAHYTGLDM